MSDYLSFWLAKLLIEVGVCMLVVVPFLVLLAIQMVRQRQCKHDGSVTETRACDAICGKCGKNLGFIGAWRKNQRERGV